MNQDETRRHQECFWDQVHGRMDSELDSMDTRRLREADFQVFRGMQDAMPRPRLTWDDIDELQDKIANMVPRSHALIAVLSSLGFGFAIGWRLFG